VPHLQPTSAAIEAYAVIKVAASKSRSLSLIPLFLLKGKPGAWFRTVSLSNQRKLSVAEQFQATGAERFPATVIGVKA
jgi:hypothetical protein